MLIKTLFILLWFCLFCSGQEVGILAGKQRAGSADQRELNLSSDRVAEVLRFLEIPFRRLEDDRIERQQLARLKVLFLPQNPILPLESAAVLEEFVSRGGKLGIFYNSDPQVLRHLGIEKTRYVSQAELGEVSGIQFAADAWKAAPPFLRQRSGNLLEPVLTGDSSDRRVAGKFIRPDGTDSGRVGVLLHANGFYMSHVYLAQDRQGGAQFFLSFIAGILEKSRRTENVAYRANFRIFRTVRIAKLVRAFSQRQQRLFCRGRKTSRSGCTGHAETAV